MCTLGEIYKLYFLPIILYILIVENFRLKKKDKILRRHIIKLNHEN